MKNKYGLEQKKCKHGREWMQNPVTKEWVVTCLPPDPEALAQGRYEPICNCPPPKSILQLLHLRR